MTKVEKRVYLDPQTIGYVDEYLGDAGSSFSERVRYCVRQQLNREMRRDE